MIRLALPRVSSLTSLAVLGGLLAALAPQPVSAQSDPILFPHDYIKERMSAPFLEVVDMEQARPMIQGDRSAQVVIGGDNGEAPIQVHWKPVREPGEGFNNEPRYEMASYEFQKLFLDEEDWVVPPRILRAWPLADYEGVRAEWRPTIRGTQSFITILSYWLQDVTNFDVHDPARMAYDAQYVRRWGNVNLFTHLIDHKDSNIGNLLISIRPDDPHIFAVDNDVAWRSTASDVGSEWRRLLVDSLPREPVERLRQVTLEDLQDALGVVWEFEIFNGYLYSTEPGPNLNPGRGVRVTRDRVQFGLTEREIQDTYNRIQRLLEDVDRGRITLHDAGTARAADDGG